MREGEGSPRKSEQPGPVSPELSPEQLEEQKLLAKFPNAKGGPSNFLQKKLQHRKFFDSGDYQMAKAKGMKLPVGQKPPQAKPPLAVNIGEQISDDGGPTSPTGNKIPTPDTVPQRKTSLVQPAASKLSPQPIHHHHPDTSPIAEMEIT